jgi:hypothetical protein
LLPAKRKAQLLANIQKNEMIGMVQQTRQHYKCPDGELHNITVHIQYALLDVGSDGSNRTWVRGAGVFGNQLVWDSATSMSSELTPHV